MSSRSSGLPETLRFAARSSPLSRLQVDLVRSALGIGAAGEPEVDPGLAGRAVASPEEGRLVALETTGDMRKEVPIHSIGGRGVFVKEVDEVVLSGRADAAVHSAKDLPSRLTEGLVAAAYLPRADPRDALVGRSLADLPSGATVASGSVRRRAQLCWLRPDLRVIELRGNVGTRLSKVPPGGAIVVAMAALDRLGLAAGATQILSSLEMLPQVGQGAIAVCCREEDEDVRAALAVADDADTRAAVESERAWLRAVGGGCEAPVAAYARRGDGGVLVLQAMIASLDGHVVVREEERGSDPAALGETLAERMLQGCGGAALLAQSGIGA